MARLRTRIKNIQSSLEENGYKVRYERGQFQAGYCVLDDRKVILVNKFFDDEAKLAALEEIWDDIKKQAIEDN